MSSSAKISSETLAILGFIAIGILGRIIPHPPNLTPLISLVMISSLFFEKKTLLLGVVSIQCITDLILSYQQDYPLLGYWSIFSYTGILAITQMLFIFRKKTRPIKKISIFTLYPLTLTFSLFFWIWTNFGVWLSTTLYPKTFMGFVACYMAAIPFLKNQLVGDLLWISVIFSLYSLCFIQESKEKGVLKEESNM